jgi:farnesyl diphosphate synthase
LNLGLTTQSFIDTYNVLRSELITDEMLSQFPADAVTYLQEVRIVHPLRKVRAHRSLLQMLDYNVPGGKLNRGMAVYDVLASIKNPAVRDSTCCSSTTALPAVPRRT